MDIKSSVLNYMKSKMNLSSRTDQELLGLLYLDSGFLDSMQLVEMIVAFEKMFGVRFSTQDMQSEEFRSIGGLVSIIERHWNSKR